MGRSLARVRTVAGPRANRAPAYAFSPGYPLAVLASAALLGRRNLGRDGVALASGWYPRPRVAGGANVPERGAFIVVMNHYERSGLRVWWPVMLISAAIWRRRHESPAVRWLITDRLYGFRVAGLTLPDPAVRWALRLVARTYDLVLVHRERAGLRVSALRGARDALEGRGRRLPSPIGITPEAASSGGRELGPAWPNSGMALAWLSRGQTPIVPAAVYEDKEGRLTARFGPPFTLDWPGLRRAHDRRDELTDRAMSAVAALLPEELRGPYRATAP